MTSGGKTSGKKRCLCGSDKDEGECKNTPTPGVQPPLQHSSVGFACLCLSILSQRSLPLPSNNPESGTFLKSATVKTYTETGDVFVFRANSSQIGVTLSRLTRQWSSLEKNVCDRC